MMNVTKLKWLWTLVKLGSEFYNKPFDERPVWELRDWINKRNAINRKLAQQLFEDDYPSKSVNGSYFPQQEKLSPDRKERYRKNSQWQARQLEELGQIVTEESI